MGPLDTASATAAVFFSQSMETTLPRTCRRPGALSAAMSLNVAHALGANSSEA